MSGDGDGMMAIVVVLGLAFLCGGLGARGVTQEEACEAQCGEHWDWDAGCVCLEEVKPASRSRVYEEDACP